MPLQFVAMKPPRTVQLSDSPENLPTSQPDTIPQAPHSSNPQLCIVPNVAKTHTLQIEKVVASGAGLGRIDGKVCFVPETLPGELVEVAITKEKKDFTEATLLQVIQASPHRIAPRCTHYGVCGGCNAQYIDYTYQVFLKEEILAETLMRVGGLLADDLAVACSGDATCAQASAPKTLIAPTQPWGYRNRVQFHVQAGQASDTSLVSGFYERGSSSVVPITCCPVLVPSLQRFVQSWNPSQEGTYKLYATSQAVYQGNQHVTVEVAGVPIIFGASLFFQSNLGALEQLVQWVQSVVTPGKGCADLYGGVGLFGAVLESLFKKVVVVEQDKRVLPFAKQNLSKGRVYTGPVERWFQETSGFGHDARQSQNFDLVVVDPPRTGLSATTRKALIHIAPKELLYVSCNPVTQARDIRHLLKGGYRLMALKGFDLYPQTFHIETVALLKRD